MFKTNKEYINNFNKSSGLWVFSEATGSSFYIDNAVHIERNDNIIPLTINDEEASKIAKNEGVIFIDDIVNIPSNVYIDTIENRKIINNYLNNNK